MREVVDWTQIIIVFAIVATNLITVITLYWHTDSKMEEHRRESNQILEAIRAEVRDFHSRLCKIETDRK
jgi:hypothetical protein